MSRRRRARTRTRRGSDPARRPAANRADLLHTRLLDTVASAQLSGLPHLVLLHGETGRGKSYAVQALYDELSRRQPGYWLPGLKPEWPPRSVATLREQRKRITPPDELRQAGATASFLWIGVSCSGYWDAPRLDPTADLLRQLRRALDETAAKALATTRRRQDWAMDRIVEGIGQIEPIVGALKFALETLAQAPKALRGDASSPTLAEQSGLFAALASYARLADALELERPALVVVVDDASGAPADLFGALAACVADPSDAVDDDGPAERRLLPRVLDQIPPLPVTFVLTAWDHTLSPTDERPLTQWLREYEDLGLERETMGCRDIFATEANGLLDRWTLGPSAETREQIVEHVVANNSHRLVNPLVLAEHVAWVEEQRDPFSGDINVTGEQISALSTSPDHHVAERIEHLRRSEGGPSIRSLLATLCSLDLVLPWALAEELLAVTRASLSVDELRERLARFAAVTTESLPDPLRSFALDVDLYDYLHRRPLTAAQEEVRAIACASFLRRWIEQLEPDSMLRGVSEHWSAARMKRMATIASCALPRMEATDTVALLAQTLTTGELPPLDDVRGPRSAVVVAWLAAGKPTEPSTDVLLTGCRELGASRIATGALIALARTRADTISGPRLEQVIEQLATSVALPDVQTALVTMLCDRGEIERARQIVEHVPLAPQSAMHLAQGLARVGKLNDALALLSANSEGNATMIRRHALLLEQADRVDEALGLLESQPETWLLARLASEMLRRAGRDRERRVLLERWVDHNADAAQLMAADHVANGRSDLARALLEPWRRSWMPAATQAARLEWADGNHMAAFQALAPFLDGRGPVEAALAQILDEIGRDGLRFRLGPGGHVEQVTRPGDPSAQASAQRATRSRREELRPAADIAADVVRELETSTPHDVAGGLLVKDASTDAGRRHVTEALRAHFAETRDRGVAAIVHYLLASIPSKEEAVACTTADFAFIARFDDAAERAGHALRPLAASEAAAVRGRLLALAALEGLPYDELQRVEGLRAHDRAFALVGGQRMVSGDPDAELRTWRALTDAVQAPEIERMKRLVWIFAASRLLAIRRAIGAGAPGNAQLLQQIFPSIRARDPVRTIEGTLYAWAANPADVAFQLYPYQAISLHAALEAAGRTKDDLGDRLVQQIATVLAVAPERRTAFEAWTALSPLAARALAVSGSSGP
jgi:hypothetical protein